MPSQIFKQIAGVPRFPTRLTKTIQKIKDKGNKEGSKTKIDERGQCTGKVQNKV